MTHLKDPVNFFDRRGNSAMSFDHLVKMVVELQNEVTRLTRLLAAQVRENHELSELIEDLDLEVLD